jgi:N-acetylglucosaminyl-diphospho-decaprenol L-rhamnosyltransferase
VGRRLTSDASSRYPHDECPAVSIVTVTWNSESVVPGFLRSIKATLHDRSHELIVVDNASADTTLRLVRELEPSARIIANSTNRGLAAANNQGITQARSDFIVICNPDVIFLEGAVGAMLDLMSRRPSAGWVIPRQRHEDGRLLTSAGDLPSLREALLGRTVASWLSRGTTRGQWWDRWEHNEERSIGRGHEAVYMVRRSAVEQVGLQDERYVLDWEGPDWTDRFHRAGWEIWIAPEAEVIHLGGVSVRQARVRWIVSTHRGMYNYFSDRIPRPWRPMLASAVALRAALKVLGAMSGVPFYRWAHGAGTSGSKAVDGD